jgi:hypothetical protein
LNTFAISALVSGAERQRQAKRESSAPAHAVPVAQPAE